MGFKFIQPNRKWSRKVGVTILAGAIGIQTIIIGLPPVHASNAATVSTAVPLATAAAQPSIDLIKQEPITSGATLQHYVWKSIRKGEQVSTDVRVIVIDLQNPHVKLDVMSGKNNKLATKQTVHGMVNETEAVAGVNGDFFDTTGEGVPLGPVITGERIVSSPSHLQGMYAFGVTEQNEPIIDTFTFQGSVTLKDGTTIPLDGINKQTSNAFYIYTSDWGSTNRGNSGSTAPTEVLVRNNTVIQISKGSELPQTPPEDGYILRAHGTSAKFIEEHLKEGDPIQAEYELKPATSLTDPSNYKMLIGGHTILVDQGKSVPFSRDISSLNGQPRARTAIGYSEDKRRAYIITADLAEGSDGLYIGELRDFMISIGVWKGLMLDGGGSTQLVSRPLGSFETELTNAPEYGGYQRPVVNGLGIYTLAPSGQLKDFLISGKQYLFLNEKTSFHLRAYDNYYNPIDMSKEKVTWKVSDEMGRFEGNEFIPSKTGSGTIIAGSGEVAKEHPIQVIGFNQIDQLNIQASEGSMLSVGSEYKLPVKVVTASGQELPVPPESIQWEFRGFDADITDDTLTVTQVDPDAETGHIIANYDGFRTITSLSAGINKKWTDFEDEMLPISFTGYPSYVKGRAKQVFGLPGNDPDNFVLLIEYNFAEGTDTKAAYAVFNEDQGMEIEGEPMQMSLRIRGDNSLNWVRAQFEDSDGKTHLVDITQYLNWSGWKSLNVDLTKYNMSYPVKLKRIYVASPEQNQDEREVRGAIAIDDIHFQYLQNPAEEKKPMIELTVNKTTMTVDGKPQTLDQAPVIINGTTLVPLRFVVDALGGQIEWDNEAKKAAVLKDGMLADLWMDSKEAVIGGKKLQSREAPRIMNQRTMIPLRLISEQFGWSVAWNQEKQTITLH